MELNGAYFKVGVDHLDLDDCIRGTVSSDNQLCKVVRQFELFWKVQGDLSGGGNPANSDFKRAKTSCNLSLNLLTKDFFWVSELLDILSSLKFVACR